MLKQRTIKQLVRTVGVGLHSGTKVELTLRPAAIDTGIVFRRIDLVPVVEFPASAMAVGDTRMASVLIKDGARVSTVEHLMPPRPASALTICMVDVNAEEIPIMDGSASSFVYLLQQAGVEEQQAAKKFIKVIKPVEVRHGKGDVRKNGHACRRMTASSSISSSNSITRPSMAPCSAPPSISATCPMCTTWRARGTFGFMQDVESLRGMGPARGGSLENAIVMDEYRILNADGLRYEDEFVRHKILDAIGDLYLVGHPCSRITRRTSRATR